MDYALAGPAPAATAISGQVIRPRLVNALGGPAPGGTPQPGTRLADGTSRWLMTSNVSFANSCTDLTWRYQGAAPTLEGDAASVACVDAYERSPATVIHVAPPKADD